MGVAIGFWKGTGILHLPRFLPGLIMLTCLFLVHFSLIFNFLLHVIILSSNRVVTCLLKMVTLDVRVHSTLKMHHIQF